MWSLKSQWVRRVRRLLRLCQSNTTLINFTGRASALLVFPSYNNQLKHNRGGFSVNPVKVYDKFGSLKKVISSKELQKRADMLIANPSQYRKTNNNKNSSA